MTEQRDVNLSYVNLSSENVDSTHLCCALGDKKHAGGVAKKRAWLKARFAEGLVFRKLDVRGKVFIEYMPIEHAWRPIAGQDWLVIHCLWVSGKYQGQGHAKALLDSCITDARAQGKAGITVLTGRTKRPFLGDPRFFKKHGFTIVERTQSATLWALVLNPEAPLPTMSPAMRRPASTPTAGTDGPFVMHTSDQCPFNAHWGPTMQGFLHDAGCETELVHIGDVAAAKNVASPLGAFSLEDARGGLVAHHLHTTGAVDRLLARRAKA